MDIRGKERGVLVDRKTSCRIPNGTSSKNEPHVESKAYKDSNPCNLFQTESEHVNLHASADLKGVN